MSSFKIQTRERMWIQVLGRGLCWLLASKQTKQNQTGISNEIESCPFFYFADQVQKGGSYVNTCSLTTEQTLTQGKLHENAIRVKTGFLQLAKQCH